MFFGVSANTMLEERNDIATRSDTVLLSREFEDIVGKITLGFLLGLVDYQGFSLFINLHLLNSIPNYRLLSIGIN